MASLAVNSISFPARQVSPSPKSRPTHRDALTAIGKKLESPPLIPRVTPLERYVFR